MRIPAISENKRRFIAALIAAFTERGETEDKATEMAYRSMPGKGKWRRMHHAARCVCPTQLDPCASGKHDDAFCRRHRCYVCQDCGRKDR